MYYNIIINLTIYRSLNSLNLYTQKHYTPIIKYFISLYTENINIYKLYRKLYTHKVYNYTYISHILLEFFVFMFQNKFLWMCSLYRKHSAVCILAVNRNYICQKLFTIYTIYCIDIIQEKQIKSLLL